MIICRRKVEWQEGGWIDDGRNGKDISENAWK